jgi:hypothetical protein
LKAHPLSGIVSGRNVRRFTLAFSFLLFLSTPPVCVAQETHVPTAEDIHRFDELVRWLGDYKDWEAWMLQWGNKVAYNAGGGIIKRRPVRPEPPEWLASDCRQSLTTEGALGEACRILAHWDGIAQLIVQQKFRGAVTNTDVERKTSFLQRVHLTAGWVPAQLPAPKVFLVAGMQVGIVEVGRATLPAVGVGVMAVADSDGGYEWKPATVIGIGYRLASFAFPGVNREATLHINVARATIHGVSKLPVGLDPSQNLIGFSLTFAKR